MTASAYLGAVVGREPQTRQQMVMKFWEYVKLNKLQDPKNMRTINADRILHPLFKGPSAEMFEIPDIFARHIRRAITTPRP